MNCDRVAKIDQNACFTESVQPNRNVLKDGMKTKMVLGRITTKGIYFTLLKCSLNGLTERTMQADRIVEDYGNCNQSNECYEDEYV